MINVCPIPNLVLFERVLTHQIFNRSNWTSITSGKRTGVRLGVSLVGEELVFVLEYHQWDKNWCSSWSITSGTITGVRLGVSLVGQELVFVLEYHQWDKNSCSSWSITSDNNWCWITMGQELVFVLEYHQWDNNWCSSWSITSG